MRITNDTVQFEYMDMHFVEQVGLQNAVEMVLDFKNTNDIPFVYDTFQLADLLGMRRRRLFYLSKNSEQFYDYVTIKKKNGGVRKLCVPICELKATQIQILRHILNKLKVSKYATAYKKGVSLKDNAKVHCSKKYILKLDLKNFFDNITFMQVYSSAFNTRYFPKQIGTILTQLCCRNDALPQGAPTSPALSNLVMKSFDDNFGRWCEKRGFDYTRYCDDITVSGNENLYSAYLKAKYMLENMGFELNEKKTNFVSNASCQLVTGLTVNEFARVPSKYRRDLRQELYYVFKFGISDAMKRSKLIDLAKIKDESDALPKYINILIGRINYVLQIERDNNYFKECLDKLNKITEKMQDSFYNQYWY